MLKELARIDRELLIFLNSLHNPALDTVMQLFSERWFWLPMYVVLVGWLIWYFRRKAYLLLPLLGLAVFLADRISSGFFKPYFARLRPCHDPDLQGLIQFIDGCGGQFGFVSSHAANTFVLASLLHFILRPGHAGLRWFFWVWAAVVSYSRVYLGVHYPSDITLGALLGILIGWLIAKVYRYFERRYFTP